MVNHIQIKTGVVFKIIPQAFLPVFSVLLAVANRYNFTPVVTGAAEHRKVAGDTHDSGFAWDVRTSNMHNPLQVYEEIRFALLAIDTRYRILYGDDAHQDHIHIAFRFQMPPLAAKTL